MSQRQLARRIRTSPSQISMVEGGRGGMSLKKGLAAAKALHVSMDYLAGWVADPRPAQEMLSDLQTKVALIRDLEEGQPDLPQDWTDYVAISEIDTSAGIGAVVHDEHVTGRMKFSYVWLRNRGLMPARCRIIRVVGESMEPTLPDGCAILIQPLQQIPPGREDLRHPHRRRAGRQADPPGPRSRLAARQRQPETSGHGRHVRGRKTPRSSAK